MTFLFDKSICYMFFFFVRVHTILTYIQLTYEIKHESLSRRKVLAFTEGRGFGSDLTIPNALTLQVTASLLCAT